MSKLTLLISIFLFSLLYNSECLSKTCQRLEKEINESVAKGFLISDESVRVPKNLEEMKVYCEKMKTTISDVRKFGKKCLQRLTRQVSNLMTYGMTKNHKRYCRTDEAQTEFYKNVMCSDGVLEELRMCHSDFIIALETANNLTDTSKKLPGVCCSFNGFIKCINEKLAKVCDEKSQKYFMKFMKTFSDDSQDMLCRETTLNPSLCETKYKFEITAKVRKYNSTYGPSMSILASL